MALTPEKYQKLQALLSDPEKELSEDFRARAQAAVDEYSNDYRERAQGPLSAEMPTEFDPAKAQQVASQVRQDADPQVEQLLGQLNPSFSLPAQVLALQPATTHPGGDQEAKNEWLRGPLDNPAGRVVFYEPPIRQVREELLANPELFRMLQVAPPQNPEAVTGIEEGDSVYQAYADYKWKQTGDEAAKAGKTAYRYSKAPYLGEGPNAHWLDSLATKLGAAVKPAAEGLSAIIGGIDDAANIGLGKAGAESSGMGWGGTLPPEDEDALRSRLGMPAADRAKQAAPLTGSKDEAVGGIPEGGSLRERNDAIEEAHPNLHTGGQVLASLAPTRWSGVAGMLWERLMGEGAKGVVKGALSGGARTAAAGGLEQTAREGVQAASSYAATGDPGTTLEGAGGRILGATAASALPGVVGGGLRGAAGRVADEVAWGPRYDQAPGRVEAQGVKPKLFKGHEAPEVVKDAEQRGRAAGGKRPLTVLAEDLDEPLTDAANYRRSDVERAGAERAAEHQATRAGKAEIPVRNLLEASVEKLRKATSSSGGKVRGVGRTDAGRVTKDVFNNSIESVSTKPSRGAIRLSPEEARAFLSPERQKELGLTKPPKKARPDTYENRLHPAKPEPEVEAVYVTPRRYSSQHTDELIERLDGSDIADLREAAMRDRDRRAGGSWSRDREGQVEAEAAARDTAERVGVGRAGGARRAVISAGRSKGQSPDFPALEETARRAGGDAPEKLRGARVAEDLGRLDKWTRLGSESPRGGQRSLWGLSALSDMAILKGAYPAARAMEQLPRGGAQRTARLSSTAARNAADSPADERREEREKKASEGYRERAKDAGAGKKTPRKKRKIVRRRVASSEAEQ